MVTDSRGNALNEGSRVRAWWDGIEFTATVKQIKLHDPGCGDHRHLILLREDDGAVLEGTSDAVEVIG